MISLGAKFIVVNQCGNLDGNQTGRVAFHGGTFLGKLSSGVKTKKDGGAANGRRAASRAGACSNLFRILLQLIPHADAYVLREAKSMGRSASRDVA